MSSSCFRQKPLSPKSSTEICKLSRSPSRFHSPCHSWGNSQPKIEYRNTQLRFLVRAMNITYGNGLLFSHFSNTIWAKGMYISIIVNVYYRGALLLSSATLMIGLQFVPQLLLAIFTTIGCSWSSIKMILYHPEILLLPSGTQFIIIN